MEDNEFLASVNPTKVSAESSLDHQANHFEPNARGTHIFAELEQDIKIVRSSETRLVCPKCRCQTYAILDNSYYIIQSMSNVAKASISLKLLKILLLTLLRQLVCVLLLFKQHTNVVLPVLSILR